MLKVIVCFVILFLGANVIKADEHFKSTIQGKVYSNFHYSKSHDAVTSGFHLSKAFVAWKCRYTSEFSSVISIDTDNPGNNSRLERIVYLKNAHFLWERNKLALAFGLIGLKQFSMQERSWGNRYVFKSFMDQFKWGPSADMGVSVTYLVSSKFQLDASVTNGEGYKQLQKDNNYLVNLGTVYQPFLKLKLRGSINIRVGNDTVVSNQMVSSLFSDYTYDSGNVGVECNWLRNGNLSHRNEAIGLSIYANHEFNMLKVFARIDYLSEKTAKGVSNDGILTIAGLEFQPMDRLKISPNIRWWSLTPQDYGISWGIHTEVIF